MPGISVRGGMGKELQVSLLLNRWVWALPHPPVVKGRYLDLHQGHLLLTVGVQEREHLGLRHTRPQQPGCNESLPLLLSHYPHDLQLLYVLLQPLLQVFWKGQGHCYQYLTNPLWAPSPGTPRSPAGLNVNLPTHLRRAIT